ncbi:MAG: hypothetical protein KAY22_20165 [Rhizorhabdus sp.]|uniref:hypothetical protein n=1 Tax=Rhizorhabdus sp. TaxID=1968843 RepID=UPI001B4A5ECB|nr:hypothetical protein [Rhizorhabdus sp.]MBP8234614.1 hypothetical protein [Rhizorhabdus sp.]
MILTTNPENAAIVDRLTAMLAQVSIGGVLTYSTASAAVGRDIQDRHRHLMEAARERAEKELGCLFECVRNVGIKRMPSADAPEIGLAAIRRVKNAAKRGGRRLERINTNSLSEGETRRVVAYRSMLGAIALIADGNKARTIAAVADPVTPIPPQNILEMFSKK